tara:strand:- start:4684 stop:5169 length:486 start_codon:yes stop_codon:yes gene_type:complete
MWCCFGKKNKIKWKDELEETIDLVGDIVENKVDDFAIEAKQKIENKIEDISNSANDKLKEALDIVLDNTESILNNTIDDVLETVENKIDEGFDTIIEEVSNDNAMDVQLKDSIIKKSINTLGIIRKDFSVPYDEYDKDLYIEIPLDDNSVNSRSRPDTPIP